MKVRLKGGRYDGKSVENNCNIRPGDALVIMKGDWRDKEYYLVYSGGEARHVANRPNHGALLFAHDELEES